MSVAFEQCGEYMVVVMSLVDSRVDWGKGQSTIINQQGMLFDHLCEGLREPMCIIYSLE